VRHQIPGFTFRDFDYLLGVRTLSDRLDDLPALNQMVVPDLWQQQAVNALRQGKDVVVHAPTGAGKTLIFELWSNQGKNHGQAIYTVPTRALANDKLAEWRARGWDVGISTGDLSGNLSAPILVATLETQKRRLIEGDGPVLLVVDEYQMLGDPDRGLNYELAIALAPPKTQLLLLSGSVANPQDVVKWLRRLGREAVLVKHDLRPVPLEEVHANNLNFHVPSEIRGYWPRLVAKALAEDLGPILIFAPRRQAAESLAAELSRHLPTPNPLQITTEQKQLVGEHLAKMLKSRIVYHHSGLSYGARAGVIEPLAKSGQLRVVVATMGLAAGINFSLRSVALAGESYRRDYTEQPLRADEILQMFGRAGRRGIDETGYVLISANEIRMRDGYPCTLARSGMVDWSALLGLMRAAAERDDDPFAEAVRVQERLFTTRPIFLGVEESMKHPDTPCGLKTDAERARHVRHRVREMLNSRGEWELLPKPVEVPLREIVVLDRPHPGSADEPHPLTRPSGTLSPGGGEGRGDGAISGSAGELRAQSSERSLPGGVVTGAESTVGDANSKKLTLALPLRGERAGVRESQPSDPIAESNVEGESNPKQEPESGLRFPSRHSILSEPTALEKIGTGTMCVLSESEAGKIYGRAITVAEKLSEDRVVMAKWIRRLTGWNGRQAPLTVWNEKIVPLLEKKMASQKTPVVRFTNHPHKITALVSLAELTTKVPVDKYGVALWKPNEREVLPEDCGRCSLVPICRQLPAATGTALLWRRLGLVDAAGVPTRRGQIVSFFQQGDGLAIASALEDESYPLDELIYDAANLDAGFRFCGEENRWAGRLALVCHERFGLQSIPGYLENGVPPKYGSGAEQIVASIHKNPLTKHAWVTELLGAGDIDRVIIEWRSLLRQIAHAPEIDWPRWTALQKLARGILRETESPTLTDLPPLEYHQTKRVDHRLILRRH
jgi:superfamily II DNA/RNA helicase